MKLLWVGALLLSLFFHIKELMLKVSEVPHLWIIFLKKTSLALYHVPQERSFWSSQRNEVRLKFILSHSVTYAAFLTKPKIIYSRRKGNLNNQHQCVAYHPPGWCMTTFTHQNDHHTQALGGDRGVSCKVFQQYYPVIISQTSRMRYRY